MIELFVIYKFGFLLVLIASVVLTIQGTHLVSRKESLQVLALAQAALLGNILGNLLFHEGQMVSIPLVCSFVMLLLLKGLFIKLSIKDETIFVVIYLFLLTFGYLVISAFPMLDSHMALGFFGDIVSLSEVRSLILFCIFFALFIFHLINYHQQIRQTINKSILSNNKLNYLEELCFASSLIFSLFGLGLLFTVCFMLFPVVIVGRYFTSFKRSLIFMSIISAMAALSGMALSLLTERVSTVPGQVSSLFLYLCLAKLFFIIRRDKRKLLFMKGSI